MQEGVGLNFKLLAASPIVSTPSRVSGGTLYIYNFVVGILDDHARTGYQVVMASAVGEDLAA